MEKMKLKEVVVLAMISVVMGIVFLGLDSLYKPLQAIAGPIGGSIVYGFYLVSAAVSMYIVRKPGAALAGSLFTGIVNLLLGSPYGINIIVASLLQGAGMEIAVFALGKYKKYNFFNISLGAVLGMILVTIRDYFIFGFSLYENIIPLMLFVRFISSIVLGAGFSIFISRGIAKTGVLSGFNIGIRKQY